jgi:hypothetical protein
MTNPFRTNAYGGNVDLSGFSAIPHNERLTMMKDELSSPEDDTNL